MTYLPSQAGEVRKKFKEYFNLDFAHYWDRSLLAYTKKIEVDIFKLDEFFMEEYKYEGSMQEFVEKQFGVEAFHFLQSLT